jgi:ketosteroid isomerase-like protein
MAVELMRVREVFKNLETGDGGAFFTHVADDVDWTVEGTHPLAGHYHSKEDFLAHTFEKLNKVLPHGTQLHVEHALTSGEWAVVELHSFATAKNGLRFDNRYCWLCRFSGDKIWWLNCSRRTRSLRRPERQGAAKSEGPQSLTSLTRSA